ncbi:Uma2 family endonuclease [Nocardia otitidiscaviarum]|uniref:Uma2 family endonuclease n=1 Tax=Nocardia otitidiscaviarum TaxID=1823 RepID=UPI001894435F|nr:Uma2 family endonuclease [Nocardia otitidiscaviarum]MBF6180338.1 Uma2 family endonuclease [Nocardia otitidiscaviarum]
MTGIFDWANLDNLQPEPITVEIWRKLPEEFCRRVEVVNGSALRCEEPSRAHQKAARQVTNMIEEAARNHMRANPEDCLDVSGDFDVVLWEVPRTTIRSPDAALFECAPNDVRPLPARYVKVIVEVVSPGTAKTDRVEKMAEYAAAGIPWYWIVTLGDNAVNGIEVHVLDHQTGAYKFVRELQPGEGAAVDVPIRVRIDWDRLTGLVL